jgi:ribosomal-protein-alanine N-acetyltransferase
MKRCMRRSPRISPVSIPRHISSVQGFFPIPGELNVRGVDVPTIRAARLDLVSMSPPFMEALLGGRKDEAARLLDIELPNDPIPPNVTRFLLHRIEQMRRDPEVQRWLARAVVLRESGRVMVGNAGFHGQPGVNAPGHPTALEVGYGILPDHRRKGYATEAVAALIGWAREQGIDHFVASVAPDNASSLAIIHKLGFVRTSEHWDDEDGLEHVYELVA